MKILLLGKNGQVGWELQRSLAPLGELLAADRQIADLENPQQLRELVSDYKPSIIVNASAYTSVDKAESEPERAKAINTDAVALLAEEARRIDSCLIHYSTDYVFNGSGSTPYPEFAPTAPLNVYGKTKLEGELAIQASGCRHLIFRTSWVYAARGNNFIKTMLRLAKEREQLSVINDQIGAPTGAELIADVTSFILRTLEQQADISGVYHLVASGATSWHNYACFILEQARKAGVALKINPPAVKAIPSSEYLVAASRPLNSRLDNQKLQKKFGIHLPVWQHGVARALEEIIENSEKQA